MALVGPFPVNNVDSVGRVDNVFRPYQRVVAEVLQVTATQAILSIEGYPVVARLTTADQAQALKEQKLAQFIVTQMNGQNIVLKMIQPGQAQAADAAAAVRQDLLVRMLDEYSLPVTENNLLLAKAMVANRLPMTMELFDELSTVLNQVGGWNESTANLAAAIKAAGLPLTAQSMMLAVQGEPQVPEELAHLLTVLRNTAARSGLPEDLRSMLQASLNLLDSLRLNPAGSREALGKALEDLAKVMGRPLENLLAQQEEAGKTSSPERSLLTLVRLQQLASRHGDEGLAAEISRFLGEAHLAQFQNLRPDPAARMQSWIDLQAALRLPGPQGQEDAPARLRVLRSSKQPEGGVDPASTQVVVQVEVAPGRTIQVALDLSGKHVRSDVMVTDDGMAEPARQELSTFQAAVESLGYLFASAGVRVGEPETRLEVAWRPEGTAHQPSLMTVNLEI